MKFFDFFEKIYVSNMYMNELGKGSYWLDWNWDLWLVKNGRFILFVRLDFFGRIYFVVVLFVESFWIRFLMFFCVLIFLFNCSKWIFVCILLVCLMINWSSFNRCFLFMLLFWILESVFWFKRDKYLISIC